MKLFNLFKKKRKPLVPPRGSHLYKVRTPDGDEFIGTLETPWGSDVKLMHLPRMQVTSGWFGQLKECEVIRGVDGPEGEEVYEK